MKFSRFEYFHVACWSLESVYTAPQITVPIKKIGQYMLLINMSSQVVASYHNFPHFPNSG